MINYCSQSKNQEIEAKFPIGDKAQLRERILALGAELRIDEVYELNYILDRDAAPLQDSYQRLRLRLQGSVATLTYKRSLKKIEGVAFREEVETEVSDFENTRLILARLGYTTRFIYEKYRSVFQAGDCVLMLDETPIGTYLEIEGDSNDQIFAMAERLGLDSGSAIDSGYYQLFLNWKAAVGVDDRDMIFRN